MEAVLESIVDVLTKAVEGKGLELYPFKIKWYNHCVLPQFHLPYKDDTLAILVLNTPAMFEYLFKPYIIHKYKEGQLDPLDECFKTEFKRLQDTLKQYKTTFIQDFEILPNKRPKILLQTAGHVAGAAYYYQRKDVQNPPWEAKTNIYGVSIHPKYGGWFAFRGVLIFQDVLIGDELQQRDPVNCVSNQDRLIELMEKFNFNWQDWTYRDVMDWPVEQKYSDEQKEYFATQPKERHALVQKWLGKQ